jgi:uncharacterized protein YbjT (DUF2867 family)
LERFLDLPNVEIRALIRNAEKGEKFKKFGVTPVIGSLDDLDTIKKESTESDVVLTSVCRLEAPFATNRFTQQEIG